MRHRIRLHLLLAAAALVAGSGILVAQQPTQAQADAIRQSCRTDYQSHCASVPTGGSAALQCLRNNLASLSPGCQGAVNAASGSTAGSGPTAAPPSAAAPRATASPTAPPMTMRQQAMVMRQACGIDFRRWCQGVPLGGGGAMACLADHRESLSEPCRKAIQGR